MLLAQLRGRSSAHHRLCLIATPSSDAGQTSQGGSGSLVQTAKGKSTSQSISDDGTTSPPLDSIQGSETAGSTAPAFDRLSLGPIQERDGRSSNGSARSSNGSGRSSITSGQSHTASATETPPCPVDLTGDGKADAVGYDTNGDGQIDSLDTTNDGLIDSKIIPNSRSDEAQKRRDDLARKADRVALLKVIECVSTETKEAITIESRQYRKLCIVGRGGSCKVYKVIGPSGEIFALKRIRVDSEDGFEQFINEIELLHKLKDKDNIIQLLDQSVNRKHGIVFMIFEYGEIDLHKLLQRQQGKPIKDNFIRLYWQQMLEAVHTIHEERIVHSDLKPANFLIVEGTLKLIDFGIAKAIQGNDTTNIVRDAQVGTINYMSPEALCPPETENEFKLSRKSDIWSMGCILYQMVFGKTPFHHITNIMAKMRAITDPNHDIKFPHCNDVHLIDTLQVRA
jgi:serine/threonine-protein kinase TTK/MPS1